MFEVIVTYRADFSEQSLGRYATDAEAQERARQISVAHHDRIVRAWVRPVREAKAKS